VVANKRTEFLNYTETQGVPQSIIKLKIWAQIIRFIN
jgi:hypothetical protein